MKNKFIYILLSLAAVLPFTACDDDDEETGDSITIVSSDLLFDAAASTGSLTFEAEGSVSVSTDSEWCTATVSGNTVTVSVTENSSISGRSTRLHLTNSSETVSVTVQQQGMRFYIEDGSSALVVGDDAATETFTITTNLDLSSISFSQTDDDWFTASINSDGDLELELSENSTGHVREGAIYYSFSEVSGTIPVYQFDFDTDIAGTVIFMYATSSGGTTNATSATLSTSGLTFTYDSTKYTIPLTFLEEKLKFRLFMGQYCGKYSSYYVYTVITGGGYIGWGSSYYIELPVAYDSSTNITTMEFTDVGAFSYGYDCIGLYAFTDTSLSSSTMSGSVLSIYDGKLMRYKQ